MNNQTSQRARLSCQSWPLLSFTASDINIKPNTGLMRTTNNDSNQPPGGYDRYVSASPLGGSHVHHRCLVRGHQTSSTGRTAAVTSATLRLMFVFLWADLGFTFVSSWWRVTQEAFTQSQPILGVIFPSYILNIKTHCENVAEYSHIKIWTEVSTINLQVKTSSYSLTSVFYFLHQF